MSTSRASEGGGTGVIRVLAALATLLLAAAAEGCAHSSTEPPARRPPEVSASAAPRSGTASPGPAARPAGRPRNLDPSEEITPEELKTIPEPVPASSGSGSLPIPRGAVETSQGGSQTDSSTAQREVAAGTRLWSVQIFATQDRALAVRTAEAASRLLGVSARVEHEGSSYKVRLGDYDSEEEARPLRDQAVRSGYPGAFRIRCASTTLNKG